MLYILDTNVVSDFMQREGSAMAWIAALPAGARVAISCIVEGEIRFGVARLPDGRRRSDLARRMEEMFAIFAIEPLPLAAGRVYAEIKTVQQARGLCLDECDLWIAASAISLQATLVSRDADFRRVEGLLLTAP